MPYWDKKWSVEPIQHGKRIHLEEPNLSETTIQHTLADCKKECRKIPVPFLWPACELGCVVTNPSGSQPHSQISEKLAATAHNLLVESEQLSSMADSLELMGI